MLTWMEEEEMKMQFLASSLTSFPFYVGKVVATGQEWWPVINGQCPTTSSCGQWCSSKKGYNDPFATFLSLPLQSICLVLDGSILVGAEGSLLLSFYSYICSSKYDFYLSFHFHSILNPYPHPKLCWGKEPLNYVEEINNYIHI